MQVSTAFVGRERPLASALASLSAERGVFLVGAAGIGKSRLTDELVRHADALGWSCLRSRATTGTSELPLGIFATRLPNTSQMLTPMFAEVRQNLMDSSAGRPLLICIDDINLLDDTSAALVHQMVTAGDAQAVVSLRAGHLAPPEITGLWQQQLLTRIDLDPLSDESTIELAQQLVGKPITRNTQMRLCELSRGNPLYVRELVAAALEGGLAIDHGGDIELTELPAGATRVGDIIRSRFAALAPDVLNALAHIAFGEPMGLGELQSCATSEQIAQLEAAELIVAESDRRRLTVRIAHPLYGEVIRAATPVLQRRAILFKLAEDLEKTGARRRSDLVKLARLSVDSGRDLDPALLTRAAALSFRAHDRVLAERLSRVAFESGGAFDAGWELANVLYGEADLDGLDEMLPAWRASASSPGERAAVGMLEGQAAFWLRHDDAGSQAIFDATIAELSSADFSDGRGIGLDEVRATRAICDVIAGRFAAALNAAEPLLNRGPDAVLIRAALAATHALRAFGRAQDAIDVMDRALESFAIIEGAVAISSRTLVGARILAMIELGKLSEAEVEARAALSDAVDELGLAMISMADSTRLFYVGRAKSAARRAEESAGWMSRLRAGISSQWAYTTMAAALALDGDAGGAARALAMAESTTDRPTEVFHSYLWQARAWVQFANGEPRIAAEILRTAASDCRANGDISGEVRCMHDLARLGHAREVAARMAELEPHLQGALFAAMAGHVRGLVRDDAELLGAACEQFAALPAYLLASEAAVSAADAARRTGDQRLGARWHSRSIELRALTEVTGGPMEPVGDAPVALTRREREIAMLAAQGLPSKDIGERLYISRRTAETHLARVYDKMGVRNRSELARLLDGGVAALAS